MEKYLEKAQHVLEKGGVIAYPTEAVFGLGCDPWNEAAITRILQLKHRSVDKGLILIASSWAQISPFLKTIPTEQLQKVQETWPGPFTWVFPATDRVPAWITGAHKTVAVRVTAHPVAQALCAEYGKPLVSTSANREGEPPAKKVEEVEKIFHNEIDYIVFGEIGDLANPTPIRDAITGKILRDG